jgi:hypothetical protein
MGQGGIGGLVLIWLNVTGSTQLINSLRCKAMQLLLKLENIGSHIRPKFAEDGWLNVVIDEHSEEAMQGSNASYVRILY